ncbi:hypothetical protein [Flavobacterium subsaxonicum]|uniref:Uncharacterized protein n=1 Tax=Flavobacterium subsaxonicum WB 4.1-42 = DSM 21790 TaxID=1121898 RepID=A0A0A2MJV8_9FLAO|nr:hypothetical protein [Flavobacterium subsaxonicum]KGO91748.1 hypothetical protein Q766_16020 [Flavobacterium subsaxonicum WB 4.1-42 = DSM 21790]
MLYYLLKYSFYTTIGVILYFGFFMLINLLTTKRPKKDIFEDEEENNPYIRRHLIQRRKEYSKLK